MLAPLICIGHHKHVTNQILDLTCSGLWELLAEMMPAVKIQISVQSNAVTTMGQSDSESLKSAPTPAPSRVL